MLVLEDYKSYEKLLHSSLVLYVSDKLVYYRFFNASHTPFFLEILGCPKSFFRSIRK